MPEFTVHVERTVYEMAKVTVTAASADAAEELVREMDEDSFDWGGGESDEGGFSITEVEDDG